MNNKTFIHRLHIEIHGMVQGMGFRPFIFNLAKSMKLAGWVSNTSHGIIIEAEGPLELLERFIIRIKTEKPALAVIYSFKYIYLDAYGYKFFEIRQSNVQKKKNTLILPDIATCPECLKEIFNLTDRRYLYPFTTCTHCGPRYSIIEALPYDRENTSMKNFQMCKDCLSEYNDPSNRRFHAQANACNFCGPQLVFWDERGKTLGTKHDAVSFTIKYLREGKIVAVKGLGGFHLFVDAKNDDAVLRLRKRKNREEKPMAVMFPDLKSTEKLCNISEKEKFLLLSNESPIVLLEKNNNIKKRYRLSNHISSDNPYLGVMLPYTPLHHILLRSINSPIIATSANLSDDTICTDENEALIRLKNIADGFLVHNRPIIRHVDDSIARIMAGRPAVLRRARGYAPLPVKLKDEIPSVMGLGGHLKNTVALSFKNNVFISQHIGDLESEKSFKTFKKTVKELKGLYELTIKNAACDTNSSYLSSQYAREQFSDPIKVQHHHAHIVSCMAENHINGNVLGISWDGTGLGEDETVWGGEFLFSSLSDFKRIGYFKQFALPGSEAAVKEPRRSALGVIYEILGKKLLEQTTIPSIKSFKQEELKVIIQMLDKKINSPMTSSVGRLFDAVASFLGIKQTVKFEGQAAMLLEFEAMKAKTKDYYPYQIKEHSQVYIIDWKKMILKVLDDLRSRENTCRIASKFHNTLIHAAVNTAKKVKEKKVLLSGGCFQNKYLTEGLISALRKEGFVPYWHQTVPPNDGGISLGQAVAAGYRIKKIKK